MKLKIHIAFVLFILFSGIDALNAQERDSLITIMGNLYDKKTLKPIEYAHIINTTNYFATISDTSGNFKIDAFPGDTLLITSIGYENEKFVNDRKHQTFVFESIPMSDKTYSIEKVEITPWGTYNDFKEKFFNLETVNPRDEIHPLFWDGIQEPPDTVIPHEPNIGNPISLIYSLLSKEGKSKRKLKELQIEKTIQKKIRSKYNQKIVSEITGLEGEEVIRFMEFCNFSDEYLLETSKYDILERVKEKYQHYKDSIKTQNNAK
ncbi:MAG: carboxypeptidase-like regulatory domain-containing protein [Bacteroidales bacterium]